MFPWLNLATRFLLFYSRYIVRELLIFLSPPARYWLMIQQSLLFGGVWNRCLIFRGSPWLLRQAFARYDFAQHHEARRMNRKTRRDFLYPLFPAFVFQFYQHTSGSK